MANREVNLTKSAEAYASPNTARTAVLPRFDVRQRGPEEEDPVFLDRAAHVVAEIVVALICAAVVPAKKRITAPASNKTNGAWIRCCS
ncbi:MAG: hypothetical protein WAK89_03575 [Candidatus Sulfotelmatobacter sp.]